MKKVVINKIIALGICFCVLFGVTENITITALAEEAQTQTTSNETEIAKTEEKFKEDKNQGGDENSGQNKNETDSVDASTEDSEQKVDSAGEDMVNIQEGKAEDESEDSSVNSNTEADQNQSPDSGDLKTQEGDAEKKMKVLLPKN